jgi:hypothetical protein
MSYITHHPALLHPRYPAQVPVGFDDLSAAITMDLFPGQPLPNQPPAPPFTVCRCPSAPDADGMCTEDSTMPVTYTRQVSFEVPLHRGPGVQLQ